MDVKKIKQYIYENNRVEFVLNLIGCHSIQTHSNYYSCGNFDGDNTKAVQVYIDSDYLKCVNHTRIICDSPERASLIDLVMHNKELPLFQAIKYLCDNLGLDYYSQDDDDDIPESLKITQLILEMKKGIYTEEDMKLKPINEGILKYYKPYVNDMFANDGISYETQQLFEIGYDDEYNAITIPIRDEIGNLVGVKGRYFDSNITENKYIYLEPCSKSKVLYGLYRAYEHIKKAGFVYVLESEKAVAQLWSRGIYNAIATGGKKISRVQRNKLSSLGVTIILCFDKDVSLSELERIARDFGRWIDVYALVDTKSILLEKESPSDDFSKFKRLKEECMVKLT